MKSKDPVAGSRALERQQEVYVAGLSRAKPGIPVDGAVASLDALAGVVEAVGGHMPVLFDSGVRSGADIFKALALGAAAVCIGRPYVYALAVEGQTGVRELIRNFMADFELTMALAGCRRVAEIDRESVTEPR